MFDTPLYRTNPIGQSDAGWMCAPCIKADERELHNNLEEADDIRVVNDVFDAIKSIEKDQKNEQL